jgi:protein-S-isoprenylcysteine O-methyltransferase Ste14
MSRSPWWKGAKGEWYVVAQIPLIAVAFFGPRTLPGWPAWTPPFTWLASIAGIIFMATGVLLVMLAVFRLGSSLTAVPYPKENGSLVETGPYRLVRHPIYSGLILMVFGWAFFVHGWLTLVYAAVIFIFFDLKSRREEEWLKARFPGYMEYQKRVRKLIPFVY